MTVDPVRFSEVCRRVLCEDHERANIGTLKEKKQHLILKQYWEPDPLFREVSYKGFVADIKNEQGIVEIQTSSFGAMRKKLEVFLEDTDVTVVYPVPHIKWISWISADGSISEKKRSPKKYTAGELLPNLIFLRPYLLHPRLHFTVVLLEVEDYRLLNGWGNGGKRGSSRYERIPVKLLDIISIFSPADYQTLLPFGDDEVFFASDIQKTLKLSRKRISAAVQVLKHVGAIEMAGKSGNKIFYRYKKTSE